MSQLQPRKTISKRVRFEVFKRDCFTCQYCGRVPPTVMLEIDHITPIAEGGGNDDGNLLTACFDCNRGKSDVPLSVAPESLVDRGARLQEMEDQLAGYREIVDAREARIERDVFAIVKVLTGQDDSTSQEAFNSIKRFLDRLPFDEVTDAALIARASRAYSDCARFKYFCGVCWNKIRTLEGVE